MMITNEWIQSSPQSPGHRIHQSFRHYHDSSITRRRTIKRIRHGAWLCRAESTNKVVILECDGILVDIHNHGHRRAFNMAFEEMGYSCSQWSPHIYYDLLRFGDSTGPGLVRAYYDMVGWPLMLSTSDRPAFVDKIYGIKQRILRNIVTSRDLPLREGVEGFLKDAIEADARLVALAATASAPEDGVLEAVMDIVGEDISQRIQCLSLSPNQNQTDEEGSEDVSEDEGSFEQLVAQVQGKGKVRSASSFVKAINLQSRGVGMRVDASMLSGLSGSVSPSYFSAIIATNGGSASSGALVAVSNGLMESAKGAGLFTAGVPPSLTARGGYTAMDASFDGFGAGGGLTWRRLSRALDSRTT